MYDIRYTKLAKNDLDEIFQLIYEDKPSMSITYIDKLYNFISLLITNPLMGIECKRKNINKNCRVLIYENYLIFYTLDEENIVILRVLNRYMDYKKEIL